jgi:hypothetical protein
LKIIKIKASKIQMKVFQDDEILTAFKKNTNMHEYEISGQGKIKVQWQ